ncbi:MAG: hypothetical protein Q6351_008150 [Candidatus Njordarchaeum guaymaensis]
MVMESHNLRDVSEEKLLLKQVGYKELWKDKIQREYILAGIIFSFLCGYSLIMIYFGWRDFPILVLFICSFIGSSFLLIDVPLSRRNLFLRRHAKMYKGYIIYVPPYLKVTYDKIDKAIFDFKMGVIIVAVKGGKRKMYYTRWYTKEEMRKIWDIFTQKGITVGLKKDEKSPVIYSFELDNEDLKELLGEK